MVGRSDKRDYIFNDTLTVTAIVIWLRDTVQEPSETTERRKAGRGGRTDHTVRRCGVLQHAQETPERGAVRSSTGRCSVPVAEV
ncbi:hypothetical protein OEIGOIKO_00058 [Streptomyces chrestomyceticus JCM 4735]|uniref:Transposase n=1 Tax=Streptomyces chrestomyceticus JCM 4735 TaxID=1306181 RepID=A0A7U9KQX8_9ACTN|nr:hypothetical protein OEIGOIKO_00058 [Streptomyces chrestomyceticus JCM 4735]